MKGSINITGDYLTSALRALWSSGSVYRAIVKVGLEVLPGVTIEQLMQLSMGEKYLTPDDTDGFKLIDGEPDEDCSVEEITEIISNRLKADIKEFMFLKEEIDDDVFETDDAVQITTSLAENLASLLFLQEIDKKIFHKVINNLMLEFFPEDPYKEKRKEVDAFINSQRVIDKFFENRIQPNPITDINNAGWIAPNGDWYGLNGEISNMLHAQIADKLLEDGIIEMESDDEAADTFLRREGWVAIHNGWILYDGYYHGKELTKEQIKAMYIYGQHYTYKTSLEGQTKIPLLGIERFPVSGAMIEMIDPILFRTKYFKV